MFKLGLVILFFIMLASKIVLFVREKFGGRHKERYTFNMTDATGNTYRLEICAVNNQEAERIVSDLENYLTGSRASNLKKCLTDNDKT